MNLRLFSSEAEEESADAARLEAGLNHSVNESVRLASLLLAIGLALLALSHLIFLPRELWRVLTPSTAACAAFFLAAHRLARRGGRLAEAGNPLGLAGAAVISLNSLLQLYLSGDPAQSTNMALVLIGIGIFFLSPGWYTAAMTLALGGWWLTAWAMGQGPAWFHYNFLMVMAGLLSLMAFNLRRRALLRLERLHLQDEQQKRLLEQAAAQAQQAREAAEAASRAKTTFLTMMSHDLRTPLTVILGYTEMLRLQAEMLGDAQMAHRLEQVEAAANNLLSMLNDLLDYARLDTEEILLTPEPVQAALVVTEVADAMTHKIEKYGNRLEVTLDGDLGEMRIDPQRLHQVLRNLLSYAARATTQGVVRLTGRREQDAQGRAWVVFEVSDDGPGLPSELAAGLFEPFPDKDLRQALRDAGGRRNEASLGLAISHRLCCRMGGELTVQSAPGAGTTFIARLPAA